MTHDGRYRWVESDERSRIVDAFARRFRRRVHRVGRANLLEEIDRAPAFLERYMLAVVAPGEVIVPARLADLKEQFRDAVVNRLYHR